MKQGAQILDGGAGIAHLELDRLPNDRRTTDQDCPAALFRPHEIAHQVVPPAKVRPALIHGNAREEVSPDPPHLVGRQGAHRLGEDLDGRTPTNRPDHVVTLNPGDGPRAPDRFASLGDDGIERPRPADRDRDRAIAQDLPIQEKFGCTQVRSGRGDPANDRHAGICAVPLVDEDIRIDREGISEEDPRVHGIRQDAKRPVPPRGPLIIGQRQVRGAFDNLRRDGDCMQDGSGQGDRHQGNRVPLLEFAPT